MRFSWGEKRKPFVDWSPSSQRREILQILVGIHETTYELLTIITLNWVPFPKIDHDIIDNPFYLMHLYLKNDHKIIVRGVL